VTLARWAAAAALWREESRGGHFRTDFPEQEEAYRLHSIQRLGQPISSSERVEPGE